MKVKFKIDIKESLDELKAQMSLIKDKRSYERIHMLYLIRSGEAKTKVMLSKLLNKNRLTITAWMNKYINGGLPNLLERNTSNGRPGVLSKDILEELSKELSSEKGYSSYNEIKVWLKNKYNIEMTYDAVFYISNRKLGASLKSVRPYNPKQDKDKMEEFKKKSFLTNTKLQKKSIKT